MALEFETQAPGKGENGRSTLQLYHYSNKRLLRVFYAYRINHLLLAFVKYRLVIVTKSTEVVREFARFDHICVQYFVFNLEPQIVMFMTLNKNFLDDATL